MANRDSTRRRMPLWIRLTELPLERRDESLVTATAPDEAPDVNVWWWGDTVGVIALVLAFAATGAGFAWLALIGGGAL